MSIRVLRHYGNGLLILVKGFIVFSRLREGSSQLKIGLMISWGEPPSFLEIPDSRLQFPGQVRFPPSRKTPANCFRYFMA